ncbi:MAG: hypothetical protein ACOX7N_10735 [Lawsonibacter sp.]|jgi:hypothetical protein
MKAVVKMESKLMNDAIRNSVSMREMYEAAGSVFELPPFESVIGYLRGGQEPELSTAPEPFRGYAVGKLKRPNEEFVIIETDGGRIIKVDQDTVTILFRTAIRDASRIAASEILGYQRGNSTFDEDACYIFFEDGSVRTDNEVEPSELADEA